MSGGSVDAGTRVNCYFLHYDPVGSGPGQVSGRMNFNGDILGIICLDAELNASDPILGNPDTIYPTGKASRGFEPGAEIVTISPDRRTMTINRYYTTTVCEQARVLVRAREQDNSSNSTTTRKLSGPPVYGAWDEETDYDVGGPTSYAINRMATPSDAWPGQLLLLEFRRTIADLGSGGAAAYRNLSDYFAPRHDGHANVLFVDGHVEGLKPEELMPSPSGAPWLGRNGWPQTQTQTP